jgi:hypothetical protein
MSDVKVGQLWFGLGFDVDQVKLNDVVQAIGKLNLNSVLAAVGVGALVDGLKQVMDVGSQLTEPMYQFNKETGLSAQKMQQWKEYAERMGVSGDVVTSSLEGLQKKMAAMKFGDSSLLSGIYLLQQAGAKINQSDLNNPFSFLSKATEGLQKIKPELRTYVAGLLGLNDQILLLKNFNGADLIPVPTEEQVVAIRKYNAAWSAVGQTLQLLAVDIAGQLSPDLNELGNDLTFWGQALNNIKEYIRPVIELTWGLYVALEAIATGNPFGLLLTSLAMILLHLHQIGDAARMAGEWIRHIYGPEGVAEGLKRKRDINRSVDSFVKVGIGNFERGARSAQIAQHNTITIIAHNIEDIEHKFVAFMEKTIAKSFYQNSANY